MSKDQSFEPVWRADARVLILGSLPGKRSIAEQGYYAHPRNSFWPIMARLCGFDPQLPYAQRLQALLENRVALWDVVASALRPGSLDSAIVHRGAEYNAIPQLIAGCSELKLIAFNGGAAEQLFKRACQNWPSLPARLSYVRLPSTSPAHASINAQQKEQHWHQALAHLIGEPQNRETG